jgi:hypothetical protein
MADFRAPTGEQLFALEAVADLTELSALPGFEDATPDMAAQILAESARLAEQGFAPLNAVGDREGARLVDGNVVLPAGFAEAYKEYAAAGWNGLAADPAHGGQGLPFALSVAVQEQFTAANMAFSLCPMLSLSAIEALQAHGDPAMKALYLPHLVAGDWTGAMQLTEPQAGSDVGALRSTATPAGDGTYRLKGQKIFITWGGHACPMHRRAPRVSACSSCPNICWTRPVGRARAMACAASRWSTSLASMPRRPARWRWARMRTASAGWWASRMAAWRPCSR